jgi:class 3 adenylate cyclase
MLNKSQARRVHALVSDCLDKAEARWDRKGSDLALEEAVAKSVEVFDSMPSLIPGHPLVTSETEEVEDFVAVVIDLRGSSSHLLQRIDPKVSKVTELQRVYYETSSLLPALALTLSFEDGHVTEYLGDGVLAFFRIADFDAEADAIYAANRAAKSCLNETLSIVNEELKSRYGLPALVIGIGMALSPAMVNLIGLPSKQQARLLGKCVYYASKLSGGENEILIDSYMKGRWPKAQSGGFTFLQKKIKGVDGYKIPQ